MLEEVLKDLKTESCGMSIRCFGISRTGVPEKRMCNQDFDTESSVHLTENDLFIMDIEFNASSFSAALKYTI